MPYPASFAVTGPAPASALGPRGCGLLSLPAGNVNRVHMGAASENTYCWSRPARRLRKDTK